MRLPTIRVFALDWSDPPFVAGHWVPEMVEAVGGVNLLNAKGEPSKVVTWRQIRDENPEVIVFMPCGYYLEEAEEEGAALFDQPDFADTPAARNGNVFAVDATSFFSRPGPRHRGRPGDHGLGRAPRGVPGTAARARSPG